MNELTPWVPDRCDIILLDCSSIASGEATNPKPFLVLSPKSFNERTSHVIGLPLGNGNGHGCAPALVAKPSNTNGNGLKHYIPSPRPKSFNWRLRGATPYPAKRVPDSFFANVCVVLNQII